MKILALSLLRLGDTLMQEQIFASIKKQNPGAELHVLIHSQFSQVAELVSNVEQWHFLPHEEIQQILVEQMASPLKAFSKLQELVHELNEQEFDVVYNCSHTLLSARLMDLLVSKRKKGIYFHNGRLFGPRSPWLNYVNEHFSQLGLKPFHCMEALAKSLDLSLPLRNTGARNTVSLQSPILLQTETSDIKKNWSFRNILELKQKLQEKFPENTMKVLVSPQRVEHFKTVFTESEILVCDLKTAKQHLASASLLISPDTSLVHLAAMVGCPSIVLFLGGANFTTTFPMSESSILLTATTRCYPCKHSEPCHYPQTLCAEELPVSSVMNAVEHFLSDVQSPFATPAYRVKKYLDSPTYLRLESLSEGASMNTSLERQLNQCVWDLYLNEDFRSPLPPYVSSARQFLGEQSSDRAANEFIESWLQRELKASAQVESVIEGLQGQMLEISKWCTGSNENIEEFIEKKKTLFGQVSKEVREKYPARQDDVRKLDEATQCHFESPFSMYRFIKRAIEEMETLNIIRGQVVLKAIVQLSERRGFHVKGARKLSTVST